MDELTTAELIEYLHKIDDLSAFLESDACNEIDTARFLGMAEEIVEAHKNFIKK